MASIDTYLHIIGIELLAILSIVLPLLDNRSVDTGIKLTNRTG